MPPNRQSASALTRTLSSEHLTSFVQTTKFPPLTTEQQQQQQQGHAEEKKEWEESAAKETIWTDAKPSAVHQEVESPKNWKTQEETESYWDWPQLSPRTDSEAEKAEARDLAAAEEKSWNVEVARRQAVIDNVLAAEEARKIVSTGSIEANLRRDAERHSKDAVVSKIVADEEARKAVSLDGIVANLLRDAKRRRGQEIVSKNQEEAESEYWDWKDKNGVTPKEAETILCASHIEEMLKKESRRINVHARVGLQTSRGGDMQGKDNYWEWEMLTKDKDKIRIIESILEDERARLLLQSSHLESNLRKDAARGASAMGYVCRGEESKEDYWAWDENAPSAPSSAPSQDKASNNPTFLPPSSSGAYWDWSPPQTNEACQAAVDSILRDEAARRVLTADHLVENLKADTWRRAKEEVDGWYYRRATEEVRRPEAEGAERDEESYWDM